MREKRKLKSWFSLITCTALLIGPTKMFAQIPFDCTPTFYQSSGDSLNLLDSETGTFIKVGGSFEDNINAIGYNALDNLIYGTGQGTIMNKLISIDKEGTLEIVAEIGISAISGDMDRSGNLMLLTPGKISEVRATPPFTVTNHAISNIPSDLPDDIVYIPSGGNDLFYGLENVAGVTYLYKFSLTTGQTTSAIVATVLGDTLPTDGSFGATWTDVDNNLYTSHNKTGEIFLIENYNSEYPIASTVAIIEETSDSDGASCPYAKNPFTSNVGDYVWYDVNHNGIQDDYFRGDTTNGLNDVKITLFNNSGTVLDFTYTNSNGMYTFDDLYPGDYTVAVDPSAFFSLDYPTFDHDGVGTPYTADFTLDILSHNVDIDFSFSDMPLASTLNTFQAEIINKKVRLSWNTESEVENQGFFIERKLELEKEWEELSSFITNPGLRGQGSATYQTEYEYIDSTALSGFTYEYRLGDVDYNTAMFYHNDLTILIEVNYTAIPDKFLLQPAYPNPFNPITTISYSIPVTSPVELYIYDIKGNLVRKLVNNVENPGIKEVVWNGQNDNGNNVHSGMYIYSLHTGSYHESKKIILIR